MTSHSIEVLLERIENLREIVELKMTQHAEQDTVFHKDISDMLGTVDQHLSKLNGQVAKNTNFRLRAKWGIGLFMAILIFFVPLFQEVVKKIFLAS